MMEISATDLRTLFERALQRVVERVGCTTAAGWARGADGELCVIASLPRDAVPKAPEPGILDALLELSSPEDLGGPHARGELRAAQSLGFSVAAPIGRGNQKASGILLIGGSEDPPGRVRPRTLAALESAARWLAGPVEAVAALSRLSHADDPVRRLDRMAAIGDLLAEIVHEVRNPLVSIKTFLQLLPDHRDDPEFFSRYLGVVSEEVRRIERLLDAVLDHARPGENPGGPARIAPVFSGAERLLVGRTVDQGIQLEVETPTESSAVAISEDSLRQVVLNLLFNALDATPPGGTVRLRARSCADQTEILVEDEGAGVPEALRAKVFEPFFSTKEDRPGGLGLAICQRLVEEAGGEISVEDRAGGGAAFRVRLARADLSAAGG